jgi:hypothetical protein
MANPSGDRGYGGEQSMGFYWGERGYFLVEGPSGAGGHAANAAGFDGVAFNPKTGHMVVYDNKAFARAGNVYSATAISENLAKNLTALEARVAARPDIPQQATILGNIRAARASLGIGPVNAWPKNVQLAVSNASGQSTGVGGKLANGTISFIDYYAAPSPKPASSSPLGSGSQARTGTAWSGPGGTPGFNPSRIQGIGSALAMFQRWAEQLSMLNAAFAAWNEVLDREPEITAKQQAHPDRPVYIRIYWKVHFENNPNMPKSFEYFGLSKELPDGHSALDDQSESRVTSTLHVARPLLVRSKRGAGRQNPWRRPDRGAPNSERLSDVRHSPDPRQAQDRGTISVQQG